jgi:hypothetical protein
MRLLRFTSRRQIQLLLATGPIAVTVVVAGPAVAAHAQQDCIGSSCNGLNSNTAGCVADAVSRSAPQTFSDKGVGEQLAIQLRGSPSCESRWARVWAFNNSGAQWLPPSGLKFTIYSDDAFGKVVYSQTATVGSRGWESKPYWVGPMVSGVSLYSKACFAGGVCTSWWPSAPPSSTSNPYCGHPVMLGLHGMAEGPSGTIPGISPELESIDIDQNAISGAVLLDAVPYTTVYANAWSVLFKTAYAVITGENNLQSAIKSYTAGCATSQDKIALVGYSMGAWVINKWIMDHPLERFMIKAVVLYGDPCKVNGNDKGLVRRAGGVGCMPAADYPYPIPGGTTANPFPVKSWTTPNDPVTGAGWAGKSFTDQLTAAENCGKNHCSHLNYTGSTEIYEGALFVIHQLIG